MYISIFENFEILDNLSSEIILNNKCGDLFIEILNNYSLITKNIYSAINSIEEGRNNGVISNYLKLDITTLTKDNYNLNYFYYLLQFEFKHNYDIFNSEKKEISELLHYIEKNERLYY